MKKPMLITALTTLAATGTHAAYASSFIDFMKYVNGAGGMTTTLVYMIFAMIGLAILSAIGPLFCQVIKAGEIGNLIRQGSLLAAMGVFLTIFGITLQSFITVLVG